MKHLQSSLLPGYGVMVLLSAAALGSLALGRDGWAACLIAAGLVFSGVWLLFLGRRVARQFKDGAAVEQAVLEAEREQVARAQQTARVVIDSLPHAVALVSPEGRVEIANPTAGLFGFKASTSANETIPPGLLSLVDQVRTTRLRAGVFHGHGDGKLPGTARDRALVQIFDGGRELFFVPQAYPILDEKAGLIGIMVLLVDATGEHQLDEARSGLLSAVSHQLKTPMTSIQMSVHLLIESALDRLTPRQAELLRAAQEDADRLQKMIEELLTSAREALAPPPLPPAASQDPG